METNSGFQPFEMIVPNDLFQAYSIHAKIEGKLPENAKLRFRAISYFKTFDWDRKHNQDWYFDLKPEVEKQTLNLELSEKMPTFEEKVPIHEQKNPELIKFGLFTDIRPSMILYYAVMKGTTTIAQPTIEVKLNYFKKNFDSFTKE